MAVTQKAPEAAARPTDPAPAPESAPATPMAAFLGRLTWMLLGPLALFLTARPLFSRGEGLFSYADLAFSAVLGAMCLGRWFEFRSGRAQTASGEPATAGHLRRYVIGAGAVGVAVWVVAAVFRNFF
jgi:hypothetical protein